MRALHNPLALPALSITFALTLVGVVFPIMTEAERAEQNRAYAEAAGIVNAELPLGSPEATSPPDRNQERKLSRALELFARVIQLNPKNWTALWMMGRVYRRLGNAASALDCFERSHLANPAQSEVLRQASSSAMELGKQEKALEMAQRAVQLDPNNAGLRANLAMACLLAQRLPDAKLAISQAVAGDPNDALTQQLKAMIQHFAAKGITPPANTAALFEYWRQNRPA